MSFVTDQVRHIDSIFDRIATSKSSEQEASARSVEHTSRAEFRKALPRILELQHYIKSVSASTHPSQPVASARALISTLKDARLSSSCSICQEPGSSESVVQLEAHPTYEHQLEELLLCKAVTQSYGTVLNTILEQTLAIQEHIWYWDDILSSHRQAGIYSLQTSPIRLWSWSKSVVEGIQSKNSKLSEGWKQFYGLVKDVVKERSIADLQARAVSPLALVRNEATQKQRELKRIRDVGSNALGLLLGEGLSNIGDWALRTKSNPNSAYSLGSGGDDQISRSISFLEAVLSNAQDSSADVESFESQVSTSAKQSSWSEGSEPRAVLPVDLSDRLINLLNTGLPNYVSAFNQSLTLYGRPSPLIRYWLPATILIFSSGTIARILFNRREAVVTWIREFGVTVRDFYVNWVVDPIRKLVGTIRHDEGSEIAIMSKRSLQGDRESLERMVIDFVTTEKGTLNESEIQSIQSSIREGDLTPVLKAYEKDMQKPIWGAIRGKLVTALLIQIQKTKVDVEVAMGGIDSLLKSQELVFGFVGLTPGLLVVFATFRWISSTFGNRRGLALGQKQGQMLRVLRNIDRIITSATPSEHGVLYYKDYGLLLCESHVLRQVAQTTFPNREFREFLVDLEELTDIQIGVERQKNVVKRMRWGYSKWF